VFPGSSFLLHANPHLPSVADGREENAYGAKSVLTNA